MNKTSKQPISKIQRQLWDECRRIIRARYIKEDGTWDCYTCGRNIVLPKDAQTGHMIPKSTCGAFLKYDLRNLRIQDYNCNINGGGQGALYIENMRRIEGNEYVDGILADRQKTVKALDFYIDLLETYKKIEK